MYVMSVCYFLVKCLDLRNSEGFGGFFSFSMLRYKKNQHISLGETQMFGHHIQAHY